MPQFFVKPEHIRDRRVTLRGADARHIINVLRLKPGDWIVLCDGEGHRYKAEITATKPLCVELEIREELPQPVMPVEIALAAAIIRPERFEWLIEKAFELGCRRFIPTATERTVAKYLPNKPTERIERWRNIALSAAKQSGLPWLPEVTLITQLTDVLKEARAQTFYCWEGLASGIPGNLPPPLRGGGEGEGDTPTLALPHQGGGDIVLIGPEGGFSPAEHESIMATHPTLLPLGPLILRSETAALAAITLVQQSAGYFQC